MFQATQMFLAEDVASSLERHSAAIAAIDAVAVEAPESVAASARVIRQQLADAIVPPEATSSPDALVAALTATVGRNADLIDAMLAATIADCDAVLTDPLVPAAEGLQRVTGG